MQLIDQTCPTPEENLALDEALLLSGAEPETLRLWHPQTPLVVAGRSTRIEQEIDTAACRDRGVPILRRVSGGATIVTGPGCLMYAVVLDARETPAAADVGGAHRYVLGRMIEALDSLDPRLTTAGTSDLALDDRGVLRKFSGNSVRLVRNRLLYHGTLMHAMDLTLLSELLRTPPRQPDYRQGRDHKEFVANLSTREDELVSALTRGWSADPAEPLSQTIATMRDLVDEKYAHDDWNLGR